jgi:hypothetical protein
MTAQMTEKLHYEGQDMRMCATPLAAYLERLEMPSPFKRVNTALWRGYIGKWSIDDGRLHLRGLLIPILRTAEDGSAFWAVEPHEIGLKDIFPDHVGGVFADWFTGELRCPQGKLVRYVHGGFASEYERDLLINVVNGEVVGSSVRTNPPGPPEGQHARFTNADCASCGFRARLFLSYEKQELPGSLFRLVWCADCNTLSHTNVNDQPLKCGECGSKRVTVADDHSLHRASNFKAAMAELEAAVKRFFVRLFRQEKSNIPPDTLGVYRDTLKKNVQNVKKPN